MKDKKIVIVIPLHLSYDLFLKDICKSLVNDGWKVWVITKLPEHFSNQIPEIQFVDLDLPRKFELLKYFKTIKHIKQIIKKINPSIIHAHFQPAALVVRLCFFSNKITKLTTSHGLIFNTMPNKIKSNLFKWLEIFIYKGFHHTWVLTKCDELAIKKYIKNVETYPTKGLGCDTSRFNRLNIDVNQALALKEKFNIKSNDFVFSFVGRFTDFKGFDVTYKAFQILKKSSSNIKLLLVGNYDDIHPSGLSTDELEALKNDNDCVFVGFSNEVEKYLYITNVLVFPSHKEGMPVNLMEAIAMEVPIITYHSRGCVDVVEDKYGFVLKSKNPYDFAQVMLTCIENEVLINEIKYRQKMDRLNFDRRHFYNYQKSQYDKFLMALN